MARAWLVALVLMTVALQGCRVVCVTILDSCRMEPDGGLTGPVFGLDGGDAGTDAGVDAGFAGCIREECATACAAVTMPAQVCFNPECLDCQDVFCGRLYTCGRDAAVPPDAAVRDAATPDAQRPDAAVPDAAVRDAATPDAQQPDATVPDAAVPDAASDAGPADAAADAGDAG